MVALTFSALALLSALAALAPADARRIHPNGNTGYCLTQTGSLNSGNINDASVSLQICDGRASQNWEAGNGRTQFRMGGKCLGPLTNYDGTSWVFYYCSERSTMDTAPGGKYRQRGPMGRYMCLDVPHGIVRPGQRVQGWRCSGRADWASQRWTMSG